LTPSNTWFLGPTKISPPKGILISLAVFIIHPSDQQRDIQTTLRATSVAIGRIYALRACDAVHRCGLVLLLLIIIMIIITSNFLHTARNKNPDAILIYHSSQATGNVTAHK